MLGEVRKISVTNFAQSMVKGTDNSVPLFVNIHS